MKWFRWFDGELAGRKAAKKPCHVFSTPRLEVLEDRVMLAAPVAVDDFYSVNENQTLRITSGVENASLNMTSDSGEYIGQGLRYDYTLSSGQFSAERSLYNRVSVRYVSNADSQAWNLWFSAPGYATLERGEYIGAIRSPPEANNEPGLDVFGHGRGCNTLTGQFTVSQVRYGTAGEVIDFESSFEQHCEGFEEAFRGSLRYQDFSGVASNDSGTDGDSLTTRLVSGPSHGSLSLDPSGVFTYTPIRGFHGDDSFTYVVSDGQTDSNVATVQITVNELAGQFVKGLYQDLLYRLPEQEGLDYWTAELRNGASRDNIARRIQQSPEYLRIQIWEMYVRYLGRFIEPDAKAFYVQMLRDGSTFEDVAALLARSQEYFERYCGLTTDGFTHVFFGDALNRHETETERQQYRAIMGENSTATTRHQVADRVFADEEYQGNVVRDYYFDFLHRSAGDSEVAFYVARLNNGERNEDILASILGSPEYFQIAVSR